MSFMNTSSKKILLVFPVLFTVNMLSCKKSEQNSKTLNADNSEISTQESQTTALTAEYDEAYMELKAQWIAGTDTPATDGLALDQGKPEYIAEKPTSFEQITAKLSSVNGHLGFIIAELENPKSEYHKGLKAKNIPADPEFERNLMKNCRSTQTYVAETVRTSKTTQEFAKKWGLSFNYLPSRLRKPIDESYQRVDRWDRQLALIEIAIRGKEKLSETTEAIGSFFSSMSKG